MEGVEDIPGTALHEGIDWQWESFAEYLDALDAMPRVARRRRAGARTPRCAPTCSASGPTTTADRRRDRRDGAAHRGGAATPARSASPPSRTILHRSQARPRARHASHRPTSCSRSATRSADAGHGVFQLVADQHGSEPERALDRASWPRRTGVTVTYALAQIAHAPEAYRDTLDDAAELDRAEGLHIVPQVPCRPTGMLFGLQSSLHPFITHPTYRALRRPAARRAGRAAAPARGPRRACSPRSRTPTTRSRIALMLALGPDLPARRPARLRAAGPSERRPPRRRARGSPPEEVVLDWLLERDGKAFLFAPLASYVDRRPRGDPRDDDATRARCSACPTAARTAGSSATRACRPTCSPTGSATATAASASRSSRPCTCRPAATAALYGLDRSRHARAGQAGRPQRDRPRRALDRLPGDGLRPAGRRPPPRAAGDGYAPRSWPGRSRSRTASRPAPARARWCASSPSPGPGGTCDERSEWPERPRADDDERSEWPERPRADDERSEWPERPRADGDDRAGAGERRRAGLRGARFAGRGRGAAPARPRLHGQPARLARCDRSPGGEPACRRLRPPRPRREQQHRRRRDLHVRSAHGRPRRVRRRARPRQLRPPRPFDGWDGRPAVHGERSGERPLADPDGHHGMAPARREGDVPGGVRGGR